MCIGRFGVQEREQPVDREMHADISLVDTNEAHLGLQAREQPVDDIGALTERLEHRRRNLGEIFDDGEHLGGEEWRGDSGEERRGEERRGEERRGEVR